MNKKRAADPAGAASCEHYTCLAFHVLNFTNKIFISPKPVSQIMSWQVSHQLKYSACNSEVVGSSPTRDELFPVSENFDFFREQYFSGQNGCCCSCMIGILCVILHEKYLYRQSLYSKSGVGKCLTSVASD